MKNNLIKISWVAQILAAIILSQTLFFKFTGAMESVSIFTKLGVEPFGRYAAGIMELITVILLLTNKTAWIGALLGMGTMAGAIMAHLIILGIESGNDGGLLFYLAVTTLICCGIVAYIRKSDLLVKFHLFLIF
jgi:hypothetical protein